MTTLLDYATAPVQNVVVKVEVRHAFDDILEATLTDAVLGCEIDADESRQVRTTLQLTLAGTEYMPTKPGDLLHPVSNNELWVWSAYADADGNVFVDTDGKQQWWNWGVFRCSQPDTKYDGKSINTVLAGMDRASVITRLGGFQGPYWIPAGTNMGQAVKKLIDDAYPGLTYNLAPTAVTLPQTIFGADTTSDNDRMADAAFLASHDGMELFFDGPTVVMRSVSDPTTAPIDGTFSGTATIVDAERTIDESTTINGVQLKGTGPGGGGSVWSHNAPFDIGSVVQPTQANANGKCFVALNSGFTGATEPTWVTSGTVFDGAGDGILWQVLGDLGTSDPCVVFIWDMDPDSYTYRFGDWGQVFDPLTTPLIPGPAQTFDDAIAQLIVMATADLQKKLGAFDNITFDCVPAPLKCGNCLAVDVDTIEIDSTYVVSTFKVDLAAIGSPMNVACRPRRQLNPS